MTSQLICETHASSLSSWCLCPGRESNPHGPFGPRDFLTTAAFTAVIWSRQNHCNSEVWPIWITFVVRTISWPYCNLASVGVSVYNSNLINVRCIYSHTRHYSSRSLLFGKILLLYSISLSIVSTHCLKSMAVNRALQLRRVTPFTPPYFLTLARHWHERGSSVWWFS